MALFPPAPGGGEQVDYGYKGKGVVMHLLADANGRPVLIRNTGAKGNEREQAMVLLNNISTYEPPTGRIVEADKGYDAYWLRREVLQMGALPLIPYRSNAKNAPSMKEVCEAFNCLRVRWKVERAIAWLKRKYRRLLMRWERLAIMWKAFTMPFIDTLLANYFSGIGSYQNKIEQTY